MAGRRERVVAAMLVFVACGQGAPAGVSEGGSSATTQPRVSTTAPAVPVFDPDLEAALLEFLGDSDGGVSAVVERDGVATMATVGVANTDGDPVTADTAFYVGSISKVFTATLVMRLVDEGSIDLDEPLSTYLPGAAAGADATIRSLLSHRSGVPDYTTVAAYFSGVFADLTRSWQPAEMIDLVANHPSARGGVDEPFLYSNTNFTLLGLLIEQAHGTDLNTVLQTEISAPLGLTQTVFGGGGVVAPTGLAAPFAEIHPDSGDADARYESIASSAFAAGSLISTPSELRLFFAALLRGDLLSEVSLTEMTPSQGAVYGLGMGIIDLGGDPTWLGHPGRLTGYHSIMFVHPETGEMLVISTNNHLLEALDLARVLVGDPSSAPTTTTTAAG